MESCKEKTAFICRNGTYQFEMMPMGLMNSGATFQWIMGKILANVDNVKCYIDDVAIHSGKKKEQITHLKPCSLCYVKMDCASASRNVSLWKQESICLEIS